MKMCPNCRMQFEGGKNYCPNCGTALVEAPQRPRPQRSKAATALLVALGVVAAAVIGLLIYWMAMAVDLSRELENEKNNQEYYEERKDDYEAQREELSERLEFYDTWVRILPDDDSGLYHRYGCELCDMSSYWIYNRNAAITLAVPCEVCCADDAAMYQG